jgi:sulfur carrier protein ThiS
MKVSVSALGNIKKYLPESKEVVLEESVCLSDLKKLSGIPATTAVVYVVNGKAQNGKYVVQENDTIKFIMVVGGG